MGDERRISEQQHDAERRQEAKGRGTSEQHQVSCVHRGNTFFGEVDVVGLGGVATVRVRYNGTERLAALDGLPADVVAHILLQELVRHDVAEAEKHPWDGVHQGLSHGEDDTQG